MDVTHRLLWVVPRMVFIDYSGWYLTWYPWMTLCGTSHGFHEWLWVVPHMVSMNDSGWYLTWYPWMTLGGTSHGIHEWLWVVPHMVSIDDTGWYLTWYLWATLNGILDVIHGLHWVEGYTLLIILLHFLWNSLVLSVNEYIILNVPYCTSYLMWSKVIAWRHRGCDCNCNNY